MIKLKDILLETYAPLVEKTKELSDKDKKNAKKKGLVHFGGGAWGKKSQKGKKGKAHCVACEQLSEYFVAILKNNHRRTNVKHWYVCLRCYEEDRWQTITSQKEPIMKSGLSIGSTKSKRRSKRNANPSRAAWEESIQATSNSPSKTKNWWEK